MRIGRSRMEWRPDGKRARGIPKNTWLEDDLKAMRLREWKRITQYRVRWNHLIEQASLDRMVTGDVTWIHQFEPESMEEKHPESPLKKKSKSQL